MIRAGYLKFHLKFRGVGACEGLTARTRAGIMAFRERDRAREAVSRSSCGIRAGAFLSPPRPLL